MVFVDKREERNLLQYRTGLGEYIPPKGEPYLTALAFRTPGPADYEMPVIDLHRNRAPEYSLRLRYGNFSDKQAEWPSPATYQPKEPGKKKRILTKIKPKIEPPDYGCSPGPVHLVKNENITAKPPKTTIKNRHYPKPSKTMKIPGPKYAATVAHLPKAPNFILNDRLDMDPDTLGPGSGGYNLRKKAAGPRYTMRAKVFPPAFRMDNPPPDWYFVKDCVPAVHAPKIGELIKPRSPSPRPAPNAYKTPKLPRHAPELTFRPFENECTFQTPGPGAYTPLFSPKRRPPAYSIRLPTKPHYPLTQRQSYGKGPATYNVRGEPAKRPAFKIPPRRDTEPNDNPAPNAYDPHEPPCTGKGYTLRIKPNDTKPPKIPAPNAYLPKNNLHHAPEYTLRIKHRDFSNREKECIPSPDAYSPGVDCGCGLYKFTTPGVNMKSRPSVYKYNGIDMARIPKCMSAEADRVRVPIS